MTTVETPRVPVATITANATLAAGKHTPVDATASSITVTLPSGVTAGSHLSVEKRDSSANTVIISGGIRGASSTVSLYWQYESVTFRYDGTTWTPTEGHKTKAALDGAYSPKLANPGGTAIAAKLPIYSARDYGAVLDGTTNDSAALAAAFTAMKNGGTHASGELVIDGPCYLGTAVVFDGGYTDTENTANWSAAGTSRFKVRAGALVAAAGIGTALSIHGFYGPDIDITFRGGGSSSDIGLDVYDMHQMDLSISGIAFAGTLLHGDVYVGSTLTAARRIRGSRVRKVHASNCGQAIYWRGFEAFGTFDNVWDNNCVNGSYFGFCADHELLHYETYNPVTQTVGLTFEGCNSFNGGVITMGDRATTALLKFIGNTADPAGTVTSSDFGSINRLRASCYMPSTPATNNGIIFQDVHSIDIDNVETFRAAAGIQVIGSNVRIKKHFSETADLNALVVSGDSYNPTPIVEVDAHYRFTYGSPVVLNSSLTGGVVKIRGHIEGNVNSSAAGSTYGIASASTGILDVDGLTIDANTHLVGLTNHSGTVRGLAGSHNAINPIAAGKVFQTDGAGNLTAVTPATGGGSTGASYFDPSLFTKYLAWTQDNANLGQGVAGVAATGRAQYSMIIVTSTITATNVSFVLATAGSGTTWTSGQNFLALYDSSGNLLGQTADITSILSAAAANTEILAALATPVSLSAGRVYAVILLNWSAGTAPTFLAAKSLAGTTLNLGTPTAFPRSASDSVTRTALASSKAITALSASQQSLLWAAIS